MATRAITNSGNAMAYAPLNTWNSGSVIATTMSRPPATMIMPTWLTANSPPAMTAIGPTCVLSGDSDMDDLLVGVRACSTRTDGSGAQLAPDGRFTPAWVRCLHP